MVTNHEKNKQALSTLSVFVRLKKKDRQQQKEERSAQKRTEEKETTKLDQKNFKKTMFYSVNEKPFRKLNLKSYHDTSLITDGIGEGR